MNVQVKIENNNPFIKMMTLGKMYENYVSKPEQVINLLRTKDDDLGNLCKELSKAVSSELTRDQAIIRGNDALLLELATIVKEIKPKYDGIVNDTRKMHELLKESLKQLNTVDLQNFNNKYNEYNISNVSKDYMNKKIKDTIVERAQLSNIEIESPEKFITSVVYTMVDRIGNIDFERLDNALVRLNNNYVFIEKEFMKYETDGVKPEIKLESDEDMYDGSFISSEPEIMKAILTKEGNLFRSPIDALDKIILNFTSVNTKLSATVQEVSDAFERYLKSTNSFDAILTKYEDFITRIKDNAPTPSEILDKIECYNRLLNNCITADTNLINELNNYTIYTRNNLAIYLYIVNLITIILIEGTVDKTPGTNPVAVKQAKKEQIVSKLKDVFVQNADNTQVIELSSEGLFGKAIGAIKSLTSKELYKASIDDNGEKELFKVLKPLAKKIRAYVEKHDDDITDVPDQPEEADTSTFFGKVKKVIDMRPRIVRTTFSDFTPLWHEIEDDDSSGNNYKKVEKSYSLATFKPKADKISGYRAKNKKVKLLLPSIPDIKDIDKTIDGVELSSKGDVNHGFDIVVNTYPEFFSKIFKFKLTKEELDEKEEQKPILTEESKEELINICQDIITFANRNIGNGYNDLVGKTKFNNLPQRGVSKRSYEKDTECWSEKAFTEEYDVSYPRPSYPVILFELDEEVVDKGENKTIQDYNDIISKYVNDINSFLKAKYPKAILGTVDKDDYILASLVVNLNTEVK